MKSRVFVLLVLLAVLTASVVSYMKEARLQEEPLATPSPTTPRTPEPSPSPTPYSQPQAPEPIATHPVRPHRSAPRPPDVQARLKAIVYSLSPDGQARTRFPADSETIYAVVTPEALNPRSPLFASFRSVAQADTEFSPAVQSTGTPQRRILAFARPEEGWQPGPYQIVFRSEQSDSVLDYGRFEIENPEAPPSTSFPEPEYLELQDDLEADPRSSFTADTSKIHLRVATSEIPAGTTVRTIWSAYDVERLADGELVAVASNPSPGPGQDSIFSFEPPPGGFLTGAYQVEIYFDQDLVGRQAFFITPAVAEPKSGTEADDAGVAETTERAQP